VANKKKLIRFKKRSEFLQVMKKGRRLFITDWLAVNWLPSADENRVGWTIPSYVGTAVTRNKLKRWLKEYLEAKWRPGETKLTLHFLFKKKPRAFYKEIDHEFFDTAVSAGLQNVERKTKIAK
jgi:RNase P protein component